MKNNPFTHEEINLMSIYNADGTREGLIWELSTMRCYLDEDSEAELLTLTDSAIRKLRGCLLYTSDAADDDGYV